MLILGTQRGVVGNSFYCTKTISVRGRRRMWNLLVYHTWFRIFLSQYIHRHFIWPDKLQVKNSKFENLARLGKPQKSSSTSGPTTPPPPPLELSGHPFLQNSFKTIFSLVVRPLSPPPPLLGTTSGETFFLQYVLFDTFLHTTWSQS